MALVLNEEQLMLKDAAAGFLQEKASVAALRALRSGEHFDPSMLEELGAPEHPEDGEPRPDRE